MKKILSVILVLTLVLASALTLSSCSKNDPEGNATLVIGTEKEQVYDIPLSKLSEGKGLMPALEYLKEKEGLEFTAENGMIYDIGGLKYNLETKTYVRIYTSLEKDFDVSIYKGEIEYDGKTLVSSVVGYSDMTLQDGVIIYLKPETW